VETTEAVKPTLFQRLRPLLLPVASGALFAGVAILVGMRVYFAPRAQKAYLRVETGRDVMTLATLQERFHRSHGTYANDFDSLARFSGNPQELRDAFAKHLDLQTLLVSGTSRQFLIEANVLDEERTLIHYRSPPAAKRNRG
jgi:hypothetical protein